MKVKQDWQENCKDSRLKYTAGEPTTQESLITTLPTVNQEEESSRFISNRPGDQSLASSRRSVQEDSTRRLEAAKRADLHLNLV